MCHNGAFAVWFLHSKKGGKIQTGLNCEVDSLSKACLWLAYSKLPKIKIELCNEPDKNVYSMLLVENCFGQKIGLLR